MTRKPSAIFYQGETLVVGKCFVHPDLGNVHVGDRFESLAFHMVRGDGDKIPVRRKYGAATGHIEAGLLRKELKPRA
jgi:hypothetical protein